MRKQFEVQSPDAFITPLTDALEDNLIMATQVRLLVDNLFITSYAALQHQGTLPILRSIQQEAQAKGSTDRCKYLTIIH